MENRFETRCIHGNQAFGFEEGTRAVSFPIYQTATFGHIGLGKSTGYDYTREKNPTRQRLEETVSALEGACDTVAFASGMAAVSACFELFGPGDHIICSEDLYGGVIRLIRTVGSKNGLEVSFADTTQVQCIREQLRPQTRALYIETPSNPMMNITDLRACAELAREKGLLLIVDNTFLSPYLQNPLELGADIVVHSGSKFLSGHNDTISGFVCCAACENGERIRLLAKTTGGVLAPFDSWLVLRGIKTLSVRMERQQSNAQQVAQWLKGHRRVTRVFYAGLEEHPGYAVNRAGAGRGQHDLLPRGQRADGAPRAGAGAAHHVCREPGRYRVAHHLPDAADAPRRAAGHAGAFGHHGDAAAAVSGAGARGGHHRGSCAGAGGLRHAAV